MKLDWHVTGLVTFTNSEIEGYGAEWPGKTFVEADDEITRIISRYMRQRRVAGVSIQAQAELPGGVSLIARAEWR